MCPPSEFYRVGCGRCRIEKEKSQLKAESDDLRAQIEHIGKTKVENITSLTVKFEANTFHVNQALL